MRCWPELLATQIVRGDGKSKVFNKSCMDGANFPTDLATVVLMNPPFPHGKKKKSAMSVEAFIDRGLEGLQDGGRLLSIVPDSVLFGGNDKVR
jgi:type I restriction enzyme M protein